MPIPARLAAAVPLSGRAARLGKDRAGGRAQDRIGAVQVGAHVQVAD
jgi:hypothetical protein